MLSVLRFLAVVFVLALPVAAQEPTQTDYTQWDKVATSAEKAVADGNNAPDSQLSALRAELVKWRTEFTQAQGANGDQITVVKDQIAALGPAPAEGATEDAAIAQRRKELTDTLAKLQAPGLSATEASSRADGIIKNIDKITRERQADKLLRLSPSPVNPANWSAGWDTLRWMVGWILDETLTRFGQPMNFETMRDNAPLIAGLLVVAFVLILRGSAWMGRITRWLLAKTAMRGGQLVSSVVSIGQVVLPVAGALMLTSALKLTTLFGPIVTEFFVMLPAVMAISIGMWWLGARIFPADPKVPSVLGFTGARRAEGQIHATALGVLFSLELLVERWIGPRAEDYLGGYGQVTAAKAREVADRAQEALSVLQAPLLIAAGIALFRLGQMIRRNLAVLETKDDAALFQIKLIRWVANLTIAVGVVGPALGLIGYISAASALVWPTIATLALLALVIVAQNYIADLYAILTKSEDHRDEMLVPILVGFGFTLLALPVLMLIWGARPSDLVEMWTNFIDGFSVGGVKLSPGVFLTFVVVFAIGYSLTRLVQGALRTSILPKTSLDRGGQTAIISGTGYVGVFLAALLAISIAGINLSSLAIVAGALSVGVGFGLQTIVQNFVSGIILLVERPISEGDWIKVGAEQGIVKAISVRSTRIETFDKSEVIIPNATLIAGQVTNMTKTNRTGRVLIPVGVAYGSDTRKVEKVLLDIAQDHPLVMMNPAPSIVFIGLGADSLNFEIRAILSDVGFANSVKTEMLHRIVERFTEEQIEIPFAQRDLWLRNPDKLAEALATEEGGRHAAAWTAAAAPKRTGITPYQTEGRKPDDPRLRDDSDGGQLENNDGSEDGDERN